jgi:hypothetical protein
MDPDPGGPKPCGSGSPTLPGTVVVAPETAAGVAAAAAPETRVADPDPDWIRIQSGQWIRIQEGKNDPQK